ncbi:MAG: DUF2185 domain-containing protein [Bacteroidia bacterium]
MNSADHSHVGFVIATKRVAEEEYKPCFVYREQPMDPQDSGWRVFAGDESQEYVDDADNSGIYAPATILAIDPSLQQVFMAPIGSAFEREHPEADWQAAEGFRMATGELEEQSIGGAWTLTIADTFDRHEEDEGDFVFVDDGRTVRIAIWDFQGKAYEEVVSLHQEFIMERGPEETPVIQRFDMTEPGMTRLGFIVEESDEEHSYHVLYGYTIVGNEVAQGVYYYDDLNDKEWALQTWLSVRCEPVDSGSMN